MHSTYITDESSWDHSIRQLPLAHILQSWGWGAFKSRWGWQPTRILWSDDEGPVAAAQLLRRAIPRTPFAIGYVSKGPIGHLGNPQRTEQLLADIVAEAKRQRCLFVKIDPDVSVDDPHMLSLLRQQGWQPGEPIQFPNTATIDLTMDEDDLLAEMKSKTRYNIRLAARREVLVRAGTINEYDLFYEMYAETGARDDFLIRPRDYYLDLWREFAEKEHAHLLLASVAGEPVAGIILFHFGSTAWYFYGASTELHRRDMPTYALQWAAIQWAKAQGLERYDLWGAPSDLDDPDDPLAGVWRFKSGFAPVFRPQIGAWDYPISRLGYRLYTESVPRFLEWLRQR